MKKTQLNTSAIPNTISRKELLIDGSDARFRATLDDLLAFASRLQQVREALAKRISLTPPQYNILMILAHSDGAGITISQMAQRLQTSVPFVVQETGRLEQANLLSKVQDSDDRRRVLLELTRKGLKLIGDIAPIQVKVNDVLFESISRAHFEILGDAARDLVKSFDDAVHIARRANI